MDNKGQLKIQEMSFMLLALMIFFVMAALFFIVFSNSNLQSEAQFLDKQKTISTILRIPDTPELSCGKQGCIDMDKLIVLMSRASFQDFFEVDGLLIRRLPFDGVEKKCNLGSYLSCNTFILKEKPQDCVLERSYVSLCRKDLKGGFSYDRCELGEVQACISR